MFTEDVSPNLSNFVKSLRDIGYSTEVAVADILDNSITAKAKYIKIHVVSEPELIFSVLDNGLGMDSLELVEALRLGTKNPESKREKTDLGRFGLGLKTASFSQCKRLTVISKKNRIVSVRQWDLDYISNKNQWLLITPKISEIEKYYLYEDLLKQDSGTLVVWEQIDGFNKLSLPDTIDTLRKHLSLVFHRFMEGIIGINSIKISINNNPLHPFNPFNIDHPATQQLSSEKIKIYGGTVNIQPYILPHHSKLSQQEYEQYATEEGYTKSQGFYLYRANRLLIYGTWWGLHRSIDAHKLVRIKVEVPNNQDKYWGIDIKKSSANPTADIKTDLRRIIKQTTELGSRPYTGRGRKIEDKMTTRFWELTAYNGEIRFALNSKHPLLEKLRDDWENISEEVLDIYLKGLQAYLPLDAIQAQLQQNPHSINQGSLLSKEEIISIADKLKSSNLEQSFIESLLRTELFKNYKELLEDGK